MLLTAAKTVPTGDGFVHSMKCDGWRCCAEVSGGRLGIWSRGGHEWASKLPELAGLTVIDDDLVLDGELVVVTADGRTDFELLGGRMMGPARQSAPRPAVSLYVFDLLRRGGEELIGRSWTERRSALEELDLAGATGGAVRVLSYSDDGPGMWEATKAIGGEGVVSLRSSSTYVPGRRVPWWKKIKHRSADWFFVAGWRPPSKSNRGGLVVAEGDEPIGVASVGLAAGPRLELNEVIRRYGRPHPTGMVTLPEHCLQAQVRYTSRTPTHGHLREASVIAVRVAGHPEPEIRKAAPVPSSRISVVTPVARR